VTCHNCQIQCRKFGTNRNGSQRFRCKSCRKTFTDIAAQPLGDMRLPMDKAEAILKLLVEGMSIRSIERVTQVHRDTIMRLLLVAGQKAETLMDSKMRNLQIKYLQVDEIWTFCGKKQRQVRKGDSKDLGSQWVTVAIDAETKLIPSFMLGKRLRMDTHEFLFDLYKRLNGRVQLTTDGLNHYTASVPMCFGIDVELRQLTKMFGDYGQNSPEGRYSPSPIKGVCIQGALW